MKPTHQQTSVIRAMFQGYVDYRRSLNSQKRAQTRAEMADDFIANLARQGVTGYAADDLLLDGLEPRFQEWLEAEYPSHAPHDHNTIGDYERWVQENRVAFSAGFAAKSDDLRNFSRLEMKTEG